MATDETRQRPRQPAVRASAAEPASAEAQLQRIAKVMARAGLCSRREAEAWVLAGRVRVNGELLQSPARDVAPGDTILVDDVPLRAPEATRLFLFHKPRGLVTSDHDPEGRPTVTSFLNENWPEGPRTVTIGRLDINTEGLLLLTNDGGLARVLELPQTGWVRRYRVRAKGQTTQATLDTLARGITIDGIDYAGIEATLDRVQGANCWLTMGLREGKNREIKRVLEHIGLEVNRLIRLSFGPFQLLDLPEGAVEEVRPRVLRDQLGPSLAAEAGVAFPEEAAPAPRVHLEPARERESRERAPGTPRRHVSTLRAEAPRRDAPRKRIERSETEDRRARTVRVERLVSTTPAPPRERKPRDRDDRRERDDRRPQDERHMQDERRESRPPPRGHLSPSARGKRERIARSGGAESPEQRRGPHSDKRPARSGDGNKRFERGRGAVRETEDRRGPRDREDRAGSRRSGPVRSERPTRDSAERPKRGPKSFGPKPGASRAGGPKRGGAKPFGSKPGGSKPSGLKPSGSKPGGSRTQGPRRGPPKPKR